MYPVRVTLAKPLFSLEYRALWLCISIIEYLLRAPRTQPFVTYNMKTASSFLQRGRTSVPDRPDPPLHTTLSAEAELKQQHHRRDGWMDGWMTPQNLATASAAVAASHRL